MRTTPEDLSELFLLFQMYIQCYHTEPRDADLLAEIHENYRARYRQVTGMEAPPWISNPRNAGRKPLNDPELAEYVYQLHCEGKTYREISALVKHSPSYVHKLIREHS